MSWWECTLLLLTVAVAAALAWLGQGVPAGLAALHAGGTAPHPALDPSGAMQLLGVAPAVVLASFVTFLAPGALWTLLAARPRGAAEWLLLGFGASLALCVALDGAAKLWLAPAEASVQLPVLWLATTGVAGVVLVRRAARGQGPARPLQAGDGRRLLSIGAAIWLAVPALAPKLFWESFNLDGIEAFEFGRSLAYHVLPHWQLQGEAFGFYPNFVLFAYPNHAFLRLFGPLEASVRLPFVLYLVLLFPALLLLIERARPRPLRGREEALLWLALATFAVVQAYNTGYEPFYADLAEMAATDTLWVLCFLGALACLFRDRLGWFVAFGAFVYLSSPGGLLLLAALGAMLVVFGGPSLSRARNASVVLIAGCLAVALAYATLHRPGPGGTGADQFGAINLLRRLYPPTVTELARFGALLFPSGVLPALSLLWVRPRDRDAWIVAGVTAAYFGVLYLQAWTSLHQFAPVMVLPLVCFWRGYLVRPERVQRWLLAALALTTSASLLLSLPRHFQINRGIQEMGAATRFEVGDHGAGYPRALQAGALLFDLLPEEYRMAYPEQPWGSDPASFVHYALREKPDGTAVRYVVRPDDQPGPPGAHRAGSRSGASIWVLDREAWQRDRARAYPRVVQSRLYEPIYRSTYRFFRAQSQLPLRPVDGGVNGPARSRLEEAPPGP